MVRVRLTRAARALLVVALGVLAFSAGVCVLAGPGWALVAGGGCTAGLGLLLVDVDEPKKAER